MIDFTSRQLRALLLVAQHENFTRAAEALFITPSGLSLLIRELERQLGFRLFDRTTRHVTLTPHGTQLVAVARRALEELDAATSRLESTAQQARHTLSIGTGLIFAAHVLPQAIKEFRRQRPETRIELCYVDPASILEKVRAGTLDLGLGPFQKTSGIELRRFFRFTFLVIRPENDLAPPRVTTTWSALKGERLILQAPTSPARQLIDRHLVEAGVDSKPVMVLNRLETVIAMVEAGEGSSIVPSFTLPVCRQRKVVTSRLINPIVPLDQYLIRNRSRKLPEAADDFAGFLQRYIARWAGRSGLL